VPIFDQATTEVTLRQLDPVGQHSRNWVE